MSKSASIAGHAFFGRSRIGDAVVELGLTVAAAGFTAAIWLAVGAWAIAPGHSTGAAAAKQPQAVTRVTLPTVYIVGRRGELEGTPVATTTAQNTAANPVTLRQ